MVEYSYSLAISRTHADNVYEYFGDDNDVGLYFNGSYLFINGGTRINGTFDINSAAGSTQYLRFVENVSFVAGVYSKGGTDELLIGSSSSTGRQFVFTDNTMQTKDHDHATQTNPTIYIHSATDPDTDNTQWLSLTHDQTDAQIQCGKGNIKIGDITHIPIVPTLTTTERNALTGVNGMIIYNSTTTTMQAYFNGSWGDI